jgi:hypothetical protein
MTIGTEPKPSNAVLRYFGLETVRQAREVFLWALPFLLLLGAGLAGLSFVVHWLFPLPLVVYVAAAGLAMVYFFFFLSRVRAVAARASEDSDTGDSPP